MAWVFWSAAVSSPLWYWLVQGTEKIETENPKAARIAALQMAS
jgi:hypothetical protein